MGWVLPYTKNLSVKKKKKDKWVIRGRIYRLTGFEDDQVLRILRSLRPINLDTFPDRLILQKLAYLAQEMGAAKEYAYSWYVHGPYSSSLTSALFLGDELNEFNSTLALTQDESEVASKLKTLLGDKLTDPSTLELFASVWYLLSALGRTSESDKDTVLAIMHKEKPHFKEPKVQSALDTILDFKKSN